MNIYSRFSVEPGNKPHQVRAPESHTSRGRPKSRASDMDEDGTAAAGNARPRIVVDLDNQIVEPVRATQPVAWFIGRPPESAIIPPVRRVFAPGVLWSDPPDWQCGPRPRQTVGAPPYPYGMKPAGWRAAISFALIPPDAGAA